jgi:nucleotide-binding universal stress UspA family protein
MKILIGMDASAESQGVVDEAIARPWPDGASFCAVHVVDMAGYVRVPALLDEGKRAAESFVKSAAEKLAHAGRTATSEVLMGFPRKALSEFARQWGSDFILVGSHGQSAIKRFLLGSVAQGILHVAPCSVEIVRPREDGAPASSHAMKILVATDGSEFSVAAVKSLASRTWPAGSQVRVISAVQLLVPETPVSAYTLSAVYPASLLEEIWNNARTRARDAVEDARRTLAATGLKIAQGEATPVGDPRVVILDQAKEWGANLIVLGSHGWRGIDRMLMGSVSESVSAHAHCSVEIIRP